MGFGMMVDDDGGGGGDVVGVTDRTNTLYNLHFTFP